jgi:hypothetical protein
MGYVEKIETTTNGEVFSITTANCILCDLQLERGTVATAWGNSYLDNASDRLYYQAQQYVSDALRNATEGSTDIYGGLVLTRHIKVGDGSNTTDFRETGGMSGYFVDGNSPAFWAGGNFDTAAITAAKYETNTTTPEDEAPYVVTHGGKVILNDAIVRGEVNASRGSFGGLKIGKYKDPCGNIDSETSIFIEKELYVGYDKYGSVVKINAGKLVAYGGHNTPYACVQDCTLEIDPDGNVDANEQQAVLSVLSNVDNIDAIRIRNGNIRHERGAFIGFKPKTQTVSSDTDLSDENGNVVFVDATLRAIELTLPLSSIFNELSSGTNFTIYKKGTNVITINGKIYYGGQESTSYSITDNKTAHLIFNKEDNLWYMTLV